MRIIITTVILFCLSVGVVKANYISGNMLLQECQDPTAEPLCSAYIVGSADAFDGLQDVRLLPRTFCLGARVTTGQIIDVVKLYLGEHPEDRDQSGAGVVALALKERFPCQTQ